MKLTFLMVMIACLNVSAKVFSQEKLSFDMKNMELSRALKLIEKQSSFRFVYSPTEGPFNKQISVKVNKAPITDILDQLLAGTSLVYSIEGDNLVTISSKGKLLKDITVTGIVVDTAGIPLPGVSISVKGVKGLGAMTNGTGKFSLKVPDNAVLVFSFISFETKEVTAVAGTTMRIVLKESNNSLDEVVVQAYGTTTRRKTTAAISTLDMKSVASLPVQSINDAVAGRIPGVIVTAQNGAPGSKSSISIRGGGTPLFVIDDIIRSSNDFANINPNDIENYSILKDAAATALYGVAAANGVVVVTTKKGAEGRVNINYSYNQIFSRPTLFPEKVSSYEQLSEINKVFRDQGIQPPTTEADLEGFRLGQDLIKYPNTDWQKVGMKDYAPEMRHDFSLTTGGKITTYYASLSYYDQRSILRTDQNYNRRTTYRLNSTSNFENINLKVTTALDGFVENNLVPSAGYGNIYSHIQNQQPRKQAYNEFGLPSNNTVDNPAVELDPTSGYIRGLSRVFNGNLGLEYSAHFLEGLKFKFNGTYNMYNSIGKSWNYLAPTYANGSTTPIYGNPPSLSADRGEGKSVTLQGYVLYNKTFGEHSIDFSGIYEQQQFFSSALSGSRTRYQILFDQFVAGPALDQTIAGSESERGRAALIGKLDYSFKGKYNLGFAVRRDGDDLFVPGKQWGTFPAISLGYIISEESFMKGLKDKHILDFLKLRGSYGKTGNLDGIGRFLYVPGYSIGNNGWVVDGKGVQTTSEPGSLPSVNYSWQTIKSRDLALEFGTLNSRLNGIFDYFYTRTTGFVAADPRFAQTLGIGLPPINFDLGANRKEGFDFSLTWNDKIQNFTYKVGFNFTKFNTLVERNTESDAALKNPYRRASGISGDFYGLGYINTGIASSNSDFLTGARIVGANNVTAGDLRYLDTNGDGQITGDDERRIGDNIFPRTNYGITLDLGYKGFSFSAVVQGAGNRDRYIGDAVQGLAQTMLTYKFNQDYWRPDNTDARFPRQIAQPSTSGVNSNNYVGSDFWFIQSKYLRLKYLQFGYDFKQGLLKKSPFQQLRLFVSGTNLLTSAKSQEYFIDPESGGGNANNYEYPIQRTISFGINAGF